MARVLSLNQIAVPDDFPADEFEAVHRKLASAYAERDEYRVFIMGALNAIAYRFTALAEYDESLRSLINAHGTGPGQPFRYTQERDLFGFFSNAHSVFDAFCFALFAIGALRDSANFPLGTDPDERNVTWSTMLRAYGKAFSTDPILSELDVDNDYYAPDRRKKKAKQITVGITFSLPDHFRFRKGLEAVKERLGAQQFKIEKTWRRDSPLPSYFLNGQHLGLDDQQKIDQFLHLINFRYVPNRVLPVDVIREEHQALRDLLVRRLGRRTGEHQVAFSAIHDTSRAMIETLAKRLTEASPDIGNIRLATPTSWSEMAFTFGYRLGQGDFELADAVQGSGIQSLLMLETLYLIDRDYFQKFGWKQAAVWAVEEPESSLHTSLEARVASFLSSIAADPNSRLQVLCTTHSDLMIQYSGSVVVATKNGAETVCELSTNPRDALEKVSHAGISRWVHPVLFSPLDPIILVEGKFDQEFLDEAFKHIRPKRRLRVVDLPTLNPSEGSGGVERMRQYVKEHANAIKSRRPVAPVVVLLDWDAAPKREQFAKLIDAPDVYKVLAWPEQALNPNIGKSFKGIERTHCDRVIELAIQRDAPIARKRRRGGADEYVVDPAEYSTVKSVLAAIVREGLQATDLIHAKILVQELLKEVGAA